MEAVSATASLPRHEPPGTRKLFSSFSDVNALLSRRYSSCCYGGDSTNTTHERVRACACCVGTLLKLKGARHIVGLLLLVLFVVCGSFSR